MVPESEEIFYQTCRVVPPGDKNFNYSIFLQIHDCSIFKPMIDSFNALLNVVLTNSE